MPTIQNMTKSINFMEKESINIKENESGLTMAGPPVDLSINPVTNKLYVAVPSAGQLYVINGLRNKHQTELVVHT